MKRLLTIVLLFFSLVVIGQNEQFIDSVFATSKAYKKRFIPDGGTMLSDRLTKAYMLMAEKNGIAKSIEFGWMSGGASKKRVDGINSFYTNLYDFYGTNDATQTTAAEQPYVSGNIAPNEVEALKNPNGDNRYVTHPEISFASTDEWSVTTIFYWDGDGSNTSLYGNGGSTTSNLYLTLSGNYTLRFENESSSFTGTITTSEKLIGKNNILTLIADGGGSLTLYLNGSFVNTVSKSTEFKFSRFINGSSSERALTGLLSAHIIRSQALTADQVAAEHALLREIYPEIPSVKIGEQEVATTSLEMVASTNGTVIAQATDNADWATGAARWCYHSNTTATGVVYNKLYNKAARDVIIANPPSGWHVATEAELTALAAYGGNALKVPDTDYWNTTGGTNTTGFSAIGSSSRNADGTFNTLKNTASFWCADSDKVLIINHNSNTATVVAVTSVNEGHSIRLIKD